MSPRARRLFTLSLVSLLAAAAVGWISARPAAALTFEVTNLADSGAGSLRQAILDANQSPGADLVTFQANLQGTIVLDGASGQIDITDDVDISGPGEQILAVSGNNDVRVFGIHHDTERLAVSISGLTIRDGAVGDNAVGDTGGAGIDDVGEDLTLSHVRFANNNSLGDGGAIEAAGDRFELVVRDSTFDQNSGDRGGAIYLADTDAAAQIDTSAFTGNRARSGAAIFVFRTNDPVTVTDTTIDANSAETNGGGIAIAEVVQGPVTIDHSTVSNNVAASGGGLYLDTLGSVPAVVTDSTISGNRSAGVGGGATIVRSGAVAYRQSTVASNSSTGDGAGTWLDRSTLSIDGSIVGDNHNVLGQHHDVAVATSSTVMARYSLISDATGLALDGGTNLTGVAPGLGVLNDNGGPTRTHLPQPGSPAINAGDPNFTGPPVDDQRGNLRLVGGRIDMGSVETVIGAAPPAESTSSSSTTSTSTSTSISVAVSSSSTFSSSVSTTTTIRYLPNSGSGRADDSTLAGTLLVTGGTLLLIARRRPRTET